MSPLHVDSRDVQALGWSLLHFVWQGTAVAALLASLSLVLRRAAPQVRYLLAAAALLLMLLLPITTFFVLRGPAAGLPEAGSALAPVPQGEGVARAATPPEDAIGAERTAARELRQRIEPLLPGLVVLWGVGVLLLSVRSFGGWAIVQRLKATGLTAPSVAMERALARLMARLHVSVAVGLYESALVQVPTVVGWLRPVILLPTSALTGLSAEQLELILAHELSHVRRRDYLANLAQTAVETLLFYHPAVWWVSNRMRVEREHCCDDLAIAAGGNPVRYARALADLEDLRSDSPALAMAATGGSLLERIARLLAPPGKLSRASRGLAALLVAASLGVAFGGRSLLMASPASSVVVAPAIALAPETEPAGPGWAEEAPDPQAAAEPSAKPRPAAKPQPQPEPRAFPLARVLELAHAGVTPEYIDEMDALGYPSLTADQLVALRSQGVGPDYVRDLAGAGYAKLSPDQLTMLRSQGVSGSFARELKHYGLADLSISDLVELRAQGVSPEFVAEMKKAGYDDLTSAKLIALRSQGVSGQYVAQMRELGYEKLALSKLIALRSQGITPEYVRSLADLGYKGIELPLLLGLRSQGVTPEYVRGLKAAGYEGLPAPLLIELRSQGVTPEFVQELKEAGLDKLKPEELIELRSQGVRGDLLKRLRAHQ